jgi:hypothetical protein
VRFVLFGILFTGCLSLNDLPAQSPPLPLNEVILQQIKQMPIGGKYSTSQVATSRFQAAVHFESGKLFVQPDTATPSYCSGATYLVFLKTIEALRDRGDLQLNPETLESLLIRGQRDGQGIWGRWNANGPGTARLFFELGSEEVGRAEHGHSVIYLGMEKRSGREYVRFWSSNIPLGYGERSVPRTRVVHAIFSRLSAPSNLARIEQVPSLDPYLASLERVRSSYVEAKEKCGM